MSLNSLKMRKGIEQNKVLYDFMNLEELAGNLFRVTQTAARINNQRPQGLPALKYTAHAVGREVRTMMIKNSGVPPEALPIAEDISGVKKRLKATDRAMKKMDKPATKKLLKGDSEPTA